MLHYCPTQWRNLSHSVQAGFLRPVAPKLTAIMKKLTSYSSWIGEIWGTFISLGLIAFFMICYWAGWVHIRELRLLNFPIMVAGIYLAFSQYKRTHDHLDYFRAITLGGYIAAVASAFALFLFILFSLIHNLFIHVVKEGPMGEFLNIYIATAAVAVEGIFSGLMATYVITNYINTDRVSGPLKPELERN